jgi:hypothetical protein
MNGNADALTAIIVVNMKARKATVIRLTRLSRIATISISIHAWMDLG